MKIEALKKIQAGIMSVNELKDGTQKAGIDLEEMEKWVQQTYPSRAAAVLADLLQSEGDVKRMEMQTIELASLFYASRHPEDEEKEKNWLPWLKLHYASTDSGDYASTPPGTYPSIL